MGILTWIVVGLLAGALAKLTMPGDDPGGIIATTLLGIAGALLGGFLGSLLGVGGVSGFDFTTLFTAVLGALLLLWVYRLASRRRHQPRQA